jgi:CIC family chloride channel protein
MLTAEEVDVAAGALVGSTACGDGTAYGSNSNWRRRLRRALPPGSGFESQGYLTKWLFISTAIGIVAGLGAIAFMFAIGFVTQVALGQIVGYLPPSPVGEGSTGLQSVARPWLLPLVTALGGLLSGVIVFSLAPEAEGHGTDAAIDAIHHKRGRVRARIPPIKLIASAITIGTGGSGGREGPTAQVSAGFGSMLARWLGLSSQEQRIAVAVGMGAGIGSIFRAPLGGALMAAEILYIHDLEVEALIPALIASIVGYAVFSGAYGYVPIFGNQAYVNFTHPVQLVYYALLGVICGVGGLLYERSFYGLAAIFHRLPGPRSLKPALGGLLVGVLGLVLPGALHTGYGWVQIGMSQRLLDLPLWVVLALPFAKILATSLSIGSGGSGGIFGPGMVIGGMLGASFWRLAHSALPEMPVDPAPFVIVGMMALFGGIAHAPLAVMLMVAEMTGNLSLLAPAMLAVAISSALVGDRTIYHSQLRTRADSPAHRARFSFPLLSSLLVRDAMTAPGPVIRTDAAVSAAEARLDSGGLAGMAVVNERGKVVGSLTAAQVRRASPSERATTPVRAVLEDAVLLEPDQPLDVALEKLAGDGMSWAAVAEGGRLVGQLHVRDVMETYKANLERSVRRAKALTAGSTLFEVRLDASSPLTGRVLRDAGFPRDTLVVSITRDGETIFPRATTRLEPGDVALIMADPRGEPALRAFLEGSSSSKR